MAFIIGWILLCLLVGVLSLPFLLALKKGQLKKQAIEAETLKSELAEAKKADDFKRQVEIESRLRQLGH